MKQNDKKYAYFCVYGRINEYGDRIYDGNHIQFFKSEKLANEYMKDFEERVRKGEEQCNGYKCIPFTSYITEIKYFED